MATIPICPLLSTRTADVNELCLEETCALYLPPAKRCSLVYLGFNAFLEVQKAQQQKA
jgi:hypothetical protein